MVETFPLDFLYNDNPFNQPKYIVLCSILDITDQNTKTRTSQHWHGAVLHNAMARTPKIRTPDINIKTPDVL